MTVAIPSLKLYSARICPWAQRATLAVHEVKADYEKIEIDLANKPDWYASQINPASKVPVLDVDGTKVPESHVILELVADLYKDSPNSILPQTPLARAEARYFIERVNQVLWSQMGAVTYGGKKEADVAPVLLTGMKEIVGLLGRHPGPFFLGEKLSIADLGVAPFIGRFFSSGKHDLLFGDVYKQVTSGAEFKPLVDYHAALTNRPSWAATYDEDYVVEFTKKRLSTLAK